MNSRTCYADFLHGMRMRLNSGTTWLSLSVLIGIGMTLMSGPKGGSSSVATAPSGLGAGRGDGGEHEARAGHAAGKGHGKGATMGCQDADRKRAAELLAD